MVLAAHEDTGFLNETKARNRAGAHIFLNEYVATPKLNGEILTIAKIIKPVMASAVEAELALLYLTAKKWCQYAIQLKKWDGRSLKHPFKQKIPRQQDS